MFRRIFRTVLQLILIVFLAFLAWEAWTAYNEEKQSVLFEKDGQPVQVNITNISNERKNWKDYIGNSKYIGFSYEGKEYHLRILQDSGWIGEGSNVLLIYNPALDLFRQHGIAYNHASNENVSRLINWTVAGIFNYTNRLLFGSIVLGVLVVLLLCSVLSNFTGRILFGLFSRWLIILCFLCGAAFFTWDSRENYQYYQQLKAGGSVSDVTMLKKHKREFDQHNKSNIPFYYYTAMVRYENREREIMISGDDFDRILPGDQIAIIHNASMDDMMAKDYSFNYWRIIFLVLLWATIGYMVKKTITWGNGMNG